MEVYLSIRKIWLYHSREKGSQNIPVLKFKERPSLEVADKEQSSYIKKEVEDIHQRPMFEEREWGELKL